MPERRAKPLIWKNTKFQNWCWTVSTGISNSRFKSWDDAVEYALRYVRGR